MPLDYSEYNDSFGLSRIETENDFELYRKIREEREKQDSALPDGYDLDQLLEIIEKQQQKIQELQQTVRMMGLGNKSGSGLFNF